MQDNVNASSTGEEGLLFLTDDQLRRGIEAIHVAHRMLASDSDEELKRRKYGRAHHRAMYFIQRSPGLTVTDLGIVLGVSKQSLNRVLRLLLENGMVQSSRGPEDLRTRELRLTPLGQKLERQISERQHQRMRAAYRAVGPEAVAGFRIVLEHIVGSMARTGQTPREGQR